MNAASGPPAPGGAPAPEGTGTPEEIEVRLAAQRDALAASVNELATRVDPRSVARSTLSDLGVRATDAAGDLRRRAGRLRERAEQTVEKARDGDQTAQGTVAAVAAGTGLAVLAAIKVLRR